MALTVYSNIPSLHAQRNLTRTQAALAKNIERLSSGMRINTAADDAAGLAISEKLRARVRSYAQAERTANDGISLLQTAEGALNEVSGILTRMRELAVQSANGTLTTSDRSYLQLEFVALRSEIDRMANTTEFNGRVLLSGSYTNQVIQIGIGGGTNDRLTVTLSNTRSTVLGSGTFLNAVSITTVAASQTAIGVIDVSIIDVSRGRSRIGAYQNRLTYAASNLASARENTSAADSRIRDVDVAEESAAMTRNSILVQAGVAVLAQANQLPSLVLGLL